MRSLVVSCIGLLELVLYVVRGGAEELLVICSWWMIGWRILLQIVALFGPRTACFQLIAVCSRTRSESIGHYRTFANIVELSMLVLPVFAVYFMRSRSALLL